MALRVESISYQYGAHQTAVLKNLSLEILPGRWGLLGRNGCGKTTLLRVLMGLYRPQKGGIFWRGQPLSYQRATLNQWRRHIGLVFQDPEQQLVAGTVQEDLSYGLCNLGLTAAEIAPRLRQALEDFDLLALADAPVHTLSLGEKKRLAIADVMILEPQILLLDEPTAYLDPQQVNNLLTLLQNLYLKGTTLIIASHDLDFIYEWADGLWVMANGQIQLSGSVPALFHHPQSQAQLQALGLGLPRQVHFKNQLQKAIEPWQGTKAEAFLRRVLGELLI